MFTLLVSGCEVFKSSVSLRDMYSMYFIRGSLSFVALHLCSQAKYFDLSQINTWCPLPQCCAKPLAFSHPLLDGAVHPWHYNLLARGSQGFAWSTSSSSSDCHYPPAEHTAVLVAEPWTWSYWTFSLSSICLPSESSLRYEHVLNCTSVLPNT